MADVNKYTVRKDDTLTKIAAAHNTTVNALLALNPDITNKDLIYVGQVIIISDPGATKTTNKSQRAKITNFGLQSNTDRTVFATWAWDQSHTDHYDIRWKYGTGDGVAFIGTTSTVDVKQSIYNAPENAKAVTFEVRPVSKTHKVGDNDVPYWKADWSKVEKYTFIPKPDKPSVPTVTLEEYKLTAKLENLNINATRMQFQVLKNDTKTCNSGIVKISNNIATYSCTVEAGADYKVRCRGVGSGDVYGEWSDYSAAYSSSPPATRGIYSLYALSSTSVHINWHDVDQAKGYEIQYTSVKRYFDSNPSGVKSVTLGSKEQPITVGHAEITGLEAGFEYFFRVRSVKFADNKNTYSAWSEIKSVTLGTAPSSPTTWSSSTTVNVGDQLYLYWTHNSTDNSRQTEAELAITVNGKPMNPIKMKNGTCSSDSDDTIKIVKLPGFTLTTGAVVKVIMTFANTISSPKLNVNGTGAIPISASDSGSYYWAANSLVIFTYDGTSWKITDNNADQNNESYRIDTSQYSEGTVIQWRVKTSGVLEYDDGSHIYGPWSVQRTVKIYAPPVLLFDVTNLTGETIEQLESFPIYILAREASDNQKPTGYQITITANESYETVDNLGNIKLVKAGDAVYQKHFATSSDELSVILSAGDLDLENNISYKVSCTVSMDSGLLGEGTHEFTVAWTDEEYWPNAEVGYDKETYSAYIRPYCTDDNGDMVEDVSLSVYRREFDGSFIELATGLNNMDETYITDPHPSLDFARYRVVAVTESTGAVSYYDVPGHPVGEKAVIIQWDENWTNFDITDDGDMEEHVWSGSLLRLPYNIDISDSYDGDTELVNYIGRKYPVSYYGTQVGHTSTWNMEIDKNDKETIYALRRLATWMGNVYVREPSGSGYWANIKVSMDTQHCVVTIPVSFTVTRVEGDM
jgi:hypothetical protein